MAINTELARVRHSDTARPRSVGADVAKLHEVPQAVLEREEHGLKILSLGDTTPIRRVLYVNCYGGKPFWSRVKSGLTPSHHLWGCLELVRMGYEVALAESLTDFYIYRNPFPHDLRLLRAARKWLRPDDIIYCGHNVLYWLPFLKKLGALRCHIVSLLYAREPLDFGGGHSGIIALNPAAAEQARKLSPKAKVAHLGWGFDLGFYPTLPYSPGSFLSCGRTNRDDRTLSIAASNSRVPITVFLHQSKRKFDWSENVKLVPGGPDWETKLGYRELLHDYYAHATASLIVVENDLIEYTACGFTSLLEAMAMARPVILTRTSALKTEIDVEAAGCGLHVPPENPEALAEAIETIAAEPKRAQAMGEKGRQLCESHYNIDRYASGLHQFFESL